MRALLHSPSLQPRAVQAAAFSPRLQRAVRLLQMSTHEFADFLAEEGRANPFLDVEPASAPVQDSPLAHDEPGDRHQLLWTNVRDQPYGSATHSGHFGSDDLLSGVAAPTTLVAHLQQQIGSLRLTERERLLAKTVAEAIDEDGYLRVPLPELASLLEMEGPSAVSELESALSHVQGCDPSGVGARSVAECLGLQLGQMPQSPVRTLAETAVRAHLALVASRNLPRLATALQATTEEVRAAICLIERLHPHPGWQVGGSVTLAITPDVTVRKSRGAWVVQSNPAALPRVRLDKELAAFAAAHGRSALTPNLAGCLDEARWTLLNIQQRVSTILQIAQAIVSRQILFLEYGSLAMKPLGLKEIADEVAVHPSTVSRAVRNKYLSTPWGLIEMRHFFSRGMEHSTGHSCAPVALKQLVGDMIAAESSDAPLSDAELTCALAQQGFVIARRTVTKYRQELGLKAVAQRRAFDVPPDLMAGSRNAMLGRPPVTSPSMAPT